MYNIQPLDLDLINRDAQDGQAFAARVEREYAQAVEAVAEQIIGGPRVVMLSGPSGSGKTTTAHMLLQCLEKRSVGCIVVSLDDFYLGKDRAPLLPDGSRDYESVHALDLEQLQECIRSILTKGAADLPQFDFFTGMPRQQKVPVQLGKRDMIIFEGIHALDPLVIGAAEGQICKMYISVAHGVQDKGREILSGRSIRLVRRMIRDYNFRNSSPKNTLHLWSGVIHGEEQYLLPYRDTAHIQINSFHPYELCIFQDEILELLSMVDPNDENAVYAEPIRACMHRFTPLPNDLVPRDSLLREFLGEG